MSGITEGLTVDRTPIVRLENDLLRLDVAPGVGGRIVSLVDRASGHEFLWRHPWRELARLAYGTPYDANFYGGIDELLPNDAPQRIDGLDCADHGELWTTPLSYAVDGESLVLRGVLARYGLLYERRMTLRRASPHVDVAYRIENPTPERRLFMWDLHIALRAEPGDRIVCPARTARVADPAWSRWRSHEPFAWPTVAGRRADVLPPADGTTDFLFLYDLGRGYVACEHAARGLTFSCTFDPAVFRYVWFFASYGGFYGHYVAILEPCTAMPMLVTEAHALGQCSVLAPGAVLETSVTLYAGPG
jgi:hypothetical protein